MAEIWKDIEGYEGLYQVSNYGKVKILPKFRNNGTNGYVSKEKLMKQCKHNLGYLFVVLSKNGKYKHFYVHRLLTQAFIPNPDNKPHVNHIDGNKQNNSIDNLEWCTAKENVIHAFKTGLKVGKCLESCSNVKLSREDVLEIRAKYIPYKYNCTMLSKEYGVHKRYILSIVKNNMRKNG